MKVSVTQLAQICGTSRSNIQSKIERGTLDKLLCLEYKESIAEKVGNTYIITIPDGYTFKGEIKSYPKKQ